MKKKVLLFARSFLAKYYGDIKSDIIEPIFVTMTSQERKYLEEKGWKVYGCFEEEYRDLQKAEFSGSYLKTSFKSDRFLQRFDQDKRLEILGKEISFWSRILDSTSPDFLVNETVAVEIAEVMAIESDKRGIPFYTYLLGFLPNTFYWKPDPFSGRMQDMKSIVPSAEDLDMASHYIRNVREKEQRPFYVSGIKRDNNGIKTFLYAYKSYLKSQKENHRENANCYFKYEDYTIFSKKRYEIKKASLFNKYDRIEEINNKGLIFYPMHLEPEATLNYFVEENYDQDLLISMLTGCIKNNQVLVVKEHPQQQGMLMTKRYQVLKSHFSNLVYLPSYVSSFEILKKCDAVVTLTSTAAWEALIFEKPVFVLGRIFFDQCPGAIRIDSLKQLKSELRKEFYTLPLSEDVKVFAAKMISLFHKGCPTPSYKENTISDFVKEMEKL